MTTKTIEELTNYNNRTETEQQLPMYFLERANDVFENSALSWLKESFEILLLSLCESIPSDNDKGLLECKQHYCEYATDACRKFLNYICTIFSVCNNDIIMQLIFDKTKNAKRLLRLYTDYSNAVSINISQFIGDDQDKKHIDSFFAVPDINKDIYVEPITEYRNKNGDHNLSAIHIPPSKFTAYSEVFRTITHEVAHHVGQTIALREKRAFLYIECFLYHIIYKYGISYNVFFEEDSAVHKSFQKLISVIRKDVVSYLNDVCEVGFTNIIDLAQEHSDVIYGKVSWTYYTATTFESINRYLDHLITDNNVSTLCDLIFKELDESDFDNLLKIFAVNGFTSDEPNNRLTFHEAFNDLFSGSSPNSDNCFTKEIKQNCVVSAVTRAMQAYIFNNANDIVARNKSEGSISELFRECYADMVMLLVSSYERKRELCEIYFNKMLGEHNAAFSNASGSDKLRFYTMFCFILGGDSQKSTELGQFFEDFEDYESKLHDDDKFLVSCVIEYLNSAKQELESCISENVFFDELRKKFKKFDNADSNTQIESILDEMESFVSSAIKTMFPRVLS